MGTAVLPFHMHENDSDVWWTDLRLLAEGATDADIEKYSHQREFIDGVQTRIKIYRVTYDNGSTVVISITAIVYGILRKRLAVRSAPSEMEGTFTKAPAPETPTEEL